MFSFVGSDVVPEQWAHEAEWNVQTAVVLSSNKFVHRVISGMRALYSFPKDKENICIRIFASGKKKLLQAGHGLFLCVCVFACVSVCVIIGEPPIRTLDECVSDPNLEPWRESNEGFWRNLVCASVRWLTQGCMRLYCCVLDVNTRFASGLWRVRLWANKKWNQLSR